MNSKNKNKLERVSTWYKSTKGLNSFMIYCVYLEFRKFIEEPILEIGPADGGMTSLIFDNLRPKTINIVEASEKYCQLLSKKFKKAAVFNSYLEDFKATKKYKTIIASHLLEHVENVDKFLQTAYKLLDNDGKFLVSVPNGLSMHRLLGVEMGLLETPTQLNDQDKKIGHFRVYDPKKLEEDLKKNGFKIEKISTSFIKFLSNAQIEKFIPEKDWIYFYSLSKNFPQNGADIFAICNK
nr:hypothetical protein [uncultured archaeon]